MKVSLLLLVAALSLLLPSFLYADQDGFQSTSDEMIEVLTREPVKYRSFAPSKKSISKRSIEVVEKKQNKAVETTIYVDESLTIPKVKALIHFDYNSPHLRAESYDLLNEVGKALLSPELQHKNIIINGHTDSDGPEDYNRYLSFQRANAVKDYLTGACNVPAKRLKLRGYGESMPLKLNDCPENKQINRRVEFELSQ